MSSPRMLPYSAEDPPSQRDLRSGNPAAAQDASQSAARPAPVIRAARDTVRRTCCQTGPIAARLERSVGRFFIGRFDPAGSGVEHVLAGQCESYFPPNHILGSDRDLDDKLDGRVIDGELFDFPTYLDRDSEKRNFDASRPSVFRAAGRIEAACGAPQLLGWKLAGFFGGKGLDRTDLIPRKGLEFEIIPGSVLSRIASTHHRWSPKFSIQMAFAKLPARKTQRHCAPDQVTGIVTGLDPPTSPRNKHEKIGLTGHMRLCGMAQYLKNAGPGCRDSALETQLVFKSGLLDSVFWLFREQTLSVKAPGP